MSNKLTKGLRKLHTSLTRGYVSRKNGEGVTLPYDGKFGKGVKVLTRNYESTQFCYVTYFVK